MAYVFFWVGVAASLWLFVVSLRHEGNDKLGVVAFPFLMFAAATAARCLGL